MSGVILLAGCRERDAKNYQQEAREMLRSGAIRPNLSRTTPSNRGNPASAPSGHRSSPAVLAGLVLGIPAALGLAQAARSLLFGVAPDDPLTLAAGIGVLGGVGLLACLLPALRVIRVDPAAALRSE